MSAETAFRSVLEERAKEKRGELLALEEMQHDLTLQIADVKRYISGLNAALEVEGLTPISIDAPATRTTAGVGATGNRSNQMPARRPMFTNMSLSDAVVALLSQGRQLHADELVRSIFTINGRDDLQRAKHTLVGTLASGVKAKAWDRVGPNTYQMSRTSGGESKEREQATDQGQPALALR